MTEKDESVKQNTETETDNQTTDTQSEETATSVDNTESNNTQDVETQEESNNETVSSEETDNESIDPKDQEINDLQKLANDNEEKYLRLYAEFENYKRRIQNENKINKMYQSQGVLTDILPTIDNIERALQIEGEDESFKSLQKAFKWFMKVC